jgi:type IV pilus assembly protein PilV
MRSLPFRAARAAGFTLVEVLVAVAIFALGVLGMVRLQAAAVKLSTDAQQRAEATFLAEQLLARMLISDPLTAASFAHHPEGTTQCAPTGAASANAQVQQWLAEVAAAFPRATADEQQVVVTMPGNEVVVRLCWRNGENGSPHSLEVSNRVQWP